MQEEANLDILLGVPNFLPEHLREKHQMIIVDPDQVAIPNFFRDGSGEKAVCFFVRFPGGFIEGNFAGVIVEKRPQDRI